MGALAIDATCVCTESGRPKLQAGTVLVEAGRIAGLAWTDDDRLALRARAADVRDARDCWLLPGLIDAHAHAYSGMLRGTQSSLPLELWALYTTAYGRALSGPALRSAIMLGAAERLRCGITAMVDHSPQVALAETSMAAHECTGLRVGYAPFLHDITDYELLGIGLPPALASMQQIAPIDPARYEAQLGDIVTAARAGSGRLVPLLGPNAPQRCSPDAWHLWRRMRDRFGIGVHTHLLETAAQACIGRKWAGGTVAEMERQGLLEGHLAVAHGIWLTEAEAAILARHDVTIVHNPASNLMLGSGTLPYARHRRSGLSLALGTDSANTGGRADHFESMRLAFMLHRAAGSEPAEWPVAADILQMATVNGAAVLGLGGELGDIRQGRLADLVLIRCGDATTLLGDETLEGVLLHANATALQAVMIGGSWVLDQGRILSFDETAVIDAAAALREEVLAAAAPLLDAVQRAMPAVLEQWRQGSAFTNSCLAAASPGGHRWGHDGTQD